MHTHGQKQKKSCIQHGKTNHSIVLNEIYGTAFERKRHRTNTNHRDTGQCNMETCLAEMKT